jgi:hypothetical protein
VAELSKKNASETIMRSDNRLSDSIMPAYPLANAYRGCRLDGRSESVTETVSVLPTARFEQHVLRPRFSSQMKLGDFGQQNSEGNDQTDHVMAGNTGLHQPMFLPGRRPGN